MDVCQLNERRRPKLGSERCENADIGVRNSLTTLLPRALDTLAIDERKVRNWIALVTIERLNQRYDNSIFWNN
jgi:hypothetical protein